MINFEHRSPVKACWLTGRVDVWLQLFNAKATCLHCWTCRARGQPHVDLRAPCDRQSRTAAWTSGLRSSWASRTWNIDGQTKCGKACKFHMEKTSSNSVETRAERAKGIININKWDVKCDGNGRLFKYRNVDICGNRLCRTMYTTKLYKTNKKQGPPSAPSIW